ncbi:hypothetical protein QDR37_15960 [Amnibacterium sp. CER49]|uniref:DUF6789 family protein n=1 Tax=Amnibacterium sp. CER49 TaxID=3039161 RepID=UPI00244AAE40|nr:DUF6789 family protein [Amnibacterium sp. CER49]MDH2445442.1 hypothetical protein [Amnibacterium sp. CER49]
MRDDRPAPLPSGAAAGLAATLAMSGLLVAAKALGALPKQPPVLLVKKVLPNLPEAVAQPLSWAAHLGYGAVGGALLPVLLRRVTPARGLAYGLAIYAASYEGWVPVAGVLPPAHADDRRRVATMLAAHVVYGAVLGRLLRRR